MTSTRLQRQIAATAEHTAIRNVKMSLQFLCDNSPHSWNLGPYFSLPFLPLPSHPGPPLISLFLRRRPPIAAKGSGGWLDYNK